MIGPFDHPWLGGLFGDPEAAEIWAPERQIAHMLAFEAAYTRALGQTDRVESAEADRIARQIETFQPDIADLSIGTARDGVVVPSLVAQLRNAIAADKAQIHTGTTSQDVIDTALTLTLRDFNDLLGDRLAGLSATLDDLREQFGQRSIMGRTRMQAALPISVADRLASWAKPIEHHSKRLSEIRKTVESLQLGGATGDRAALAPDGAKISKLMADALRLQNPPLAWHSMRGGIAEYASLLSLISGSLGKFGQDICLMAQQGIDEVALKGGGGSSAMPHKQNPILSELLITLARFNATQVSGMHHALVHEQERSGSAWGLEWMILPQMAQTTARGLAVAAQLCRNIETIGAK